MTARRASCIVATGLLFAGWSPRTADAAGPPESPADASAAMRVYIDPATGRPASPSPAPPAAATAEPLQPKTAEGVIEQPAPGGGTMIRLPESYKSPLAATVGPDGVVHVGQGPAGGAPDGR